MNYRKLYKEHLDQQIEKLTKEIEDKTYLLYVLRLDARKVYGSKVVPYYVKNHQTGRWVGCNSRIGKLID